jgi:hypothetical protein
MTTPVLEQCWEQCYRTLATEQNRGILQEVYKTGNTVKRMKDIYSANGVTYLLDSTLATQCWEQSSSSSSSGSFENELTNGNTAAGIWQLQLNMMGIISAMIGSTYSFPVQFNENAAWSCKEFSCLDCCATMKLGNVASTYLTPIETNSSACMDGLLEPACRLAYHDLYTYGAVTPAGNCPAGTVIVNNLTVAILNSNAHVNIHSRGNYADYSPCQTFFDLRYSLGMNNVALDDMKRFESDDDFHNYMPDDPNTQAVVQKLSDCIYDKCCGSASTAVLTAATCLIATGHTGELISALTPLPPLVG